MNNEVHAEKSYLTKEGSSSTSRGLAEQKVPTFHVLGSQTDIPLSVLLQTWTQTEMCHNWLFPELHNKPRWKQTKEYV